MQRTHHMQVLREDAQGLATHFDMKFVWQALFDYKSWVQVGAYMGYVVSIPNGPPEALRAPTSQKRCHNVCPCLVSTNDYKGHGPCKSGCAAPHHTAFHMW